MSVSLRLAEPVVFLYNLDSATDRRERRQQRRRAQQEVTDAFTRRQGYSAPVGGFGLEAINSGGAITYAPPTGRGGAGAGAGPTRSRSRGRSSTPVGRRPGDSRSPSRSRADSPERSNGHSGGIDEGERLEPDEANIDLVRPPAVLRGVLSFTLTKPTKIKSVGVKLKGISRTDWPEGIGPRRLDTVERSTLIEKEVLFFDAASTGNARRAVSLEAAAFMGRGDSRSRTRPDSQNGFGRSFSLARDQREDGRGRAMPDENHDNRRDPAPGAGRSDPRHHFREARTISEQVSVRETFRTPGQAPGEQHLSRSTLRAGSPVALPAPSEAGHIYEEPRPDLASESSLSLVGSRGSSLHERPPHDATDTRGNSRTASILSYEESEATEAARVLPPPTGDSDARNTAGSSSNQHSVYDAGSSQAEFNGRDRDVRLNHSLPGPAPSDDATLGSMRRNLSPTPLSPIQAQLPISNISVDSDPNSSTSGLPLHASAGPGRGASPGPSALRMHSTSDRSTSRGLSGDKPKSARFSLSSLVRGKPADGRPTSPDGSARSTSRNTSGSRGRTSGLKAIKNALAATAHIGTAESDSDQDDTEEAARGRQRSSGWQEFKAGTYNYPLYITVPNSLPPTIHANHGAVTYMLKGFVKRAGALTTNLATLSEVHIVAAPNEDDLEASESIIVERLWETQLSYKIVVQCKSAPLGGEIPVSITLHPLTKMRLFRLSAVLEEKFTFYAKERRIARSPNTRKYDLLRIQYPEGAEPLLPIISENPNALDASPLSEWIAAAGSTDSGAASILDPLGPWNLQGNIKVPDCNSTLHFSTSHEAANISVLHSLKIILRVERGDDEALDSKGHRKKFDIIVEAPLHILSCRTSTASALPTYSYSPPPQERGGLSQASLALGAFHPHELSDIERYSASARAGGPVMPNSAGIAGNLGATRQSPHTAESTGVSDAQLQNSLMSVALGGGVAAPPPTYQFAHDHPETALVRGASIVETN